jgi:hypothetical protein
MLWLTTPCHIARGVEEFDLIQAFARLRANFEHVFPAEAA